MLCVGGCKALRGLMQSFARTDAKLCVRVGLNWHRNVCPILDKRKKGKDSPYGVLRPKEISTEPRRAQPRVERSVTLGVSGF